MKLTLYSYWRSSCSWRVRLALSIKGLPYEYRAVHLAEDENQCDEFRSISPLGQVPALVVGDPRGGQVLTQSLAIVHWLESMHPEPALLSADPWDRARAWELAEIVNAGTQPHQNLQVLRALTDLGVDPTAWSRQAIERGLAAYVQALDGRPGRFSTGDTLSVADVCLIPQLYNARRFQVDLARYPRLLEIEGAAEVMPAFRAAHPSAQPDALPDTPAEKRA